MDEERFDCIVVGAGPAGCSAAIRLAKAGLSTLLLERAERPGEKNLSGGVLWGHDLDDLVPDWWKTAPVERHIDHKRLTFLTEDSAFSLDFSSSEWDIEPYNGFSVLRARFDEWLARQTESAGATLVTGITVRDLFRENGRVSGVVGVEEGDVIRSDAVVVADGANSRLTLSAGLRRPLPAPPPGRVRRKKGDPPYMCDTLDPHWMALGVKEVFKMPAGVIEDRFALRSGSGFANEVVLGYMKHGVKAGASLYTNRESISLNVVIETASLRRAVDSGAEVHSFDIIEDLRAHPYMESLLRGGEMVEYGAHLIPEGGVRMMPRLYDSGVLVAGDAAGLCFSNGLVLQGMNYAIVSGKMAADTIIEAKRKGDLSAGAMSAYQARLESSYVLKDLRRFRGVEEVAWNDRIHHVYPYVMADLMKALITERSRPKEKVRKVLRRIMKRHGVGVLRVVRDAVSMGWKV